MLQGKREIKISLIIATYNWPEALRLCLMSVGGQSVMPDEVVIADDGSDRQTKELVEEFGRVSAVPVKHVWQEDKGFRLAKIRNKALAEAAGNYIVQIDGDIILHKHFIKDHRSFARKKTFVRASRIYINEKASKGLIQKRDYRVSAFSKGITNFFSALRIPFLRMFFEYNYKTKGAERYEIHGCNMAFWRDDAIAVNGYDESFQGWGSEDKEFIARLLNQGYKRRFLKMGAIAFHLYHKESSRSFLEINQHLLEQTIKEQKTFCEKGINQYL